MELTKMDDRKLLEMAAKAAGLEEFSLINGRPAYRFRHSGLQDWRPWNPLEDDGDALRLAVRLRLPINYGAADEWGNGGPETLCGQYWDPMDGRYYPHRQAHDGDALAASRRAIVRAAAEIGLSQGE